MSRTLYSLSASPRMAKANEIDLADRISVEGMTN